MDHNRGKDPTPQGRGPDMRRESSLSKPQDYESEKYENSAPGPEVRKDGVFFMGYKRENAYPDNPNTQP